MANTRDSSWCPFSDLLGPRASKMDTWNYLSDFCITNTAWSELDSHVPPVIPKPTLQVSWMSCWLWSGRVSNWLPASFPFLSSPWLPASPHHSPTHLLWSLWICAGIINDASWWSWQEPPSLWRKMQTNPWSLFQQNWHILPQLAPSNSFRAMAVGREV